MPCHFLRFWPFSRRTPLWPETSRLLVGSTGSGKSEGELAALVRLAGRRDCAVVLLDGHGPLAFRAAGHWAARGHESRLVYEPLDATDRVLCWSMLPRSDAADPLRRHIEDDEMRDDVMQCFLAQRNLDTFNDRPWTKEWLQAVIDLGLGQPESQPLGALLDAFRPGTARYEKLLAQCDRPDVVEKWRAVERIKRKNEVQYEMQTGASRRLLEQVCTSEVVRLRSRPGPFDWLAALRQRRLIAFDAGGLRSREIKRTLFLLASLQVIHAVRRHFAQTREPLPVVLVLEEAGALGLVTPFVLTALQELRKAGLAIHLITQSSLDFGDRGLFEAVLANVPWQAWYQALSPADQELGGRALANATFDAHAVHFTRLRVIHDGVRPVGVASRGESVDASTGNARRDVRSATSFLTRYRRIAEAHYKTPQLHEQEYRTMLATLRVGERFVRDRRGVRRERGKPLRLPWFHQLSDDAVRDLIARVRRRPLYVPAEPRAASTPGQALGAAERLRLQESAES